MIVAIATNTINANSGYVYRSITEMDAWGAWSSANVGADTYLVERDFYPQTGQMQSTRFDTGSANHQTLSYTYDEFGNLYQQQTTTPGETPAFNTETYHYDDLQRLDLTTRSNGLGVDYDYDAVGNFRHKDDFATLYEYDTSRPNAVKSVDLVGGGTRTYGYDANGNRTTENGAQTVWYNAFNKPTQISRNGSSVQFSYGADQMRYKMVRGGETTIYIDKMYERIIGGGTTKHRHFIEDVAVVTVEDHGPYETYEMALTHRDRLGSTTAIGDANGTLIETFSYDAFGKPRDGNQTDRNPAHVASMFTTRGFTDHEHLDSVGLIHMNGRGYDYDLGRFLSVDPVIQAPGNSQSLNPYSYIMNNPLAGTDPTGYVAQSGCGDLVIASGIFCANAEAASRLGEDEGTRESALNIQVNFGTAVTNGSFSPTVSSFLLRFTNPQSPIGIGSPANRTSVEAGFLTSLWESVNPFSFSNQREHFDRLESRQPENCTADCLDPDTLEAMTRLTAILPAFGPGTMPITQSTTTRATSGLMALRASSGRSVLNLGSGNNPMRGALNLDIRATSGVDVAATASRLPFRAGTFTDVHSINPYGFNPVSLETARIMKLGGLLRVSGARNNSFARPLSESAAREAGFELLGTGPIIRMHQFGIQRATTGGRLPTENSITTIYRRIE